MPTPPKVLENMDKNLTEEERQLREQAEKGVIPDRGRLSQMEKPAIMTKNAAAGRYWKKVLERMDGLVILDDLDSDALGVYCVMMAPVREPVQAAGPGRQGPQGSQGGPGGGGRRCGQAGRGERQDAVPGAEHPPVCREAGAHALRPGAAGPEAGPGRRRCCGDPDGDLYGD